MWMSSMTDGVNRKFWPRMLLLRSPSRSRNRAAGFSSCINLSSQHELLLGRLEIVVIPQLLAGDDLAHARKPARRLDPVDVQLARKPGDIQLGHLSIHCVDAERFDLAADVNGAVVHRIAKILSRVAQNDH